MAGELPQAANSKGSARWAKRIPSRVSTAP